MSGEDSTPKYLVLDTNVFVGDPRLEKSTAWQLLSKQNIVILLPEVVIQEAVPKILAAYRNKPATLQAGTAGVMRAVRQLESNPFGAAFQIKNREVYQSTMRFLRNAEMQWPAGEAAEQHYLTFVSEKTKCKVLRLPMPVEFGHDVLLRRCLDCRKPFRPKPTENIESAGKSKKSEQPPEIHEDEASEVGWKDALIWLSLVEFAKREPGQIFFVTHNRKDFIAPPSQIHAPGKAVGLTDRKDSQELAETETVTPDDSEQRTRREKRRSRKKQQQLRRDLHSDLVADLEQHSIATERIKIFQSIADFEASEILPTLTQLSQGEFAQFVKDNSAAFLVEAQKRLLSENRLYLESVGAQAFVMTPSSFIRLGEFVPIDQYIKSISKSKLILQDMDGKEVDTYFVSVTYEFGAIYERLDPPIFWEESTIWSEPIKRSPKAKVRYSKEFLATMQCLLMWDTVRNIAIDLVLIHCNLTPSFSGTIDVKRLDQAVLVTATQSGRLGLEQESSTVAMLAEHLDAFLTDIGVWLDDGQTAQTVTFMPLSALSKYGFFHQNDDESDGDPPPVLRLEDLL